PVSGLSQPLTLAASRPDQPMPPAQGPAQGWPVSPAGPQEHDRPAGAQEQNRPTSVPPAAHEHNRPTSVPPAAHEQNRPTSVPPAVQGLGQAVPAPRTQPPAFETEQRGTTPRPGTLGDTAAAASGRQPARAAEALAGSQGATPQRPTSLATAPVSGMAAGTGTGAWPTVPLQAGPAPSEGVPAERPPTGPAHAAGLQPPAAHAQPTHAQPAHAGPTHAGPTHAGPTHAGPTHAGPTHAERKKDGSAHASPARPDGSWSVPAQAGPARPEQDQSSPAEAPGHDASGHAEQTGRQQAGLHQAGSQQAKPHQTEQQTGSHQTGPQQADPHQADPHQAGSQQTALQQAGPQPENDSEAGAGRHGRIMVPAPRPSADAPSAPRPSADAPSAPRPAADDPSTPRDDDGQQEHQQQTSQGHHAAQDETPAAERLGAHAAPYMDPDGTLHNLRPIARLTVAGPDAEPRRPADTEFGGQWFGGGRAPEEPVGANPDETPPEGGVDLEVNRRAAVPMPVPEPAEAAQPEVERPTLSAADLEAIRWRLDGGTLREVVDDKDALRELGERLDGPLADEVDNVAKAGLLSVRAEVYRLLGELGMAAAASRLALAHAESAKDVQSTVIAEAELAHILRLRGDHKEADRLFARAAGSRAPDTLRSVVHENAGRSCYDQGRHMEALDHFATAVRLGRPDDSELAARIGVCLEAVYIHVLRDGWGPYPRSREAILGRPPKGALDEDTAEQKTVRPGD
ncbi:MAG: hypothetical protein ABW022_03125, partial [Actinoplanes sp.]